MAFCRYCGATLSEGQACTCPQSRAAAQQAAAQQPVQQPAYQQPQQAAYQQSAYQQPVYQQSQQSAYQQPYQQAPQQPSAAQQQAAAAQAAAVGAAKNIGSYLQQYFTDAGRAVRTVVEQDNLTFAIILTVIRALAMGLAVYGLLHKACSIAYQTAVAAMGAFGGYSEMMGTSIKAPLMGSLLYGALIGLVGMALYIVMVFVLMKLQKGGASLKAVYEASAANGILPTALLLLTFLVSFVSLPFAIVCLILAALSWVVCGVLTAQLLCADNVSGKFWLLYFVGVILVFWVGNLVLPNLFLSAVGGISVSSMGSVPITLKQSIDAMKMQIAQMGGWSGVINEIISEFF